MQSESNYISQEEFELIERFLLGTLKEQEQANFESRLASDENWKNEVDAVRTQLDALRLAGFKEKLQRHGAISNQKSGNRNRNWFSVAASILLLVGVGFYFFSRSNDEENVYAQFIEVEPGLPVPMSAVADYAFYDAMVDYKNELYDKAISKWTTLALQNPDSDTLNYFIASALFNKRDYPFSASYFDKVIAEPSSVFKFKAEHYRLCCAILLNDKSAIEVIHASDNSPYKSKMEAMESLYKKESHD